MTDFTSNAKVYIAGHTGLVGSALVRKLQGLGFKNLLLRNHADLELRDQRKVHDFFHKEKPEFVFLTAARVGGIRANDIYRGDFIRENLEIQNNVIGAAFDAGVKKFLFLGSACVYPKMAEQPIKETSLFGGPLEPTNEAYAMAKLAGIILCRSLNLQYQRRFISVIPTAVYGPHDNYDLENSHVLPALLRKFHEAKNRGDSEITLWGSGRAQREFIHVDDLASALIHCMEHYESPEIMNIGSGQESSIAQLGQSIAKVVDFNGSIIWDSTKPDGAPRKLLDSQKFFAMGWKPTIKLEEGIRSTYRAYLADSR